MVKSTITIILNVHGTGSSPALDNKKSNENNISLLYEHTAEHTK
ncbi:hypothetical protein ACQCVM_06035 [Rossellomorea aquimaris]|nr:hypothetical protein [Bacillus sp. CH30_1T]